MNQVHKIGYSTPIQDEISLPDILRLSSWENASENIQVSHADFINETAHTVKVVGPPIFSITIFIDGKGSMKVENGMPLKVKPNTVALFYSPREALGEHQLYGGSRMKYIDIRFDIGLIKQISQLPITELIARFENQMGVDDIQIASCPSTAQLNYLAQSILNCEMTGAARKLFLNAKALEALSLVISSTTSQQSSINKKDRALIESAVKLLHDRYHERWTIETIAKKIGLNEKKLKHGFRQLMDNTVHKYLEEVRITSSIDKLLSGASVTEVAYSVGYSNPSHFAKAFRRIYGTSPSQWKNSAVL